MRQRVLLVAGWVVAAAVTSMVASAAVAVAGGQVNDLPLSKVLAADVAALPDAEAECASLPCEPPASGGPEQSTTITSAGAQDGPGSSHGLDPAGGEEDDGAARFDDPERPDGLTPTIPPDEVGEAADPSDVGPGLAGPTPAKFVTVQGGSASFYVVDGRVEINYYIPGYGYEAIPDDDGDPTKRTVLFVPETDFLSTRSAEPSEIVARWVDGQLIIETFEL